MLLAMALRTDACDECLSTSGGMPGDSVPHGRSAEGTGTDHGCMLFALQNNVLESPPLRHFVRMQVHMCCQI